MATATINKPASKPAPTSQPAATNAKGTNTVTSQKIAVSKSTGASVNKPNNPSAVEAPLNPMSASTLTLGFYNEDQQPLPQGTVRLRPLSTSETDELHACEAIIRENLPKFLAVGKALALIQAKKLWRLYSPKWEDYLETRLGITRAYASMQAAAAKAMENLLTIGEQVGPPTTERQLRPLVRLSTEDQVEAWKLASTKAAGGKVTGKNVEDAVSELLAGGVPTQTWRDALQQKLVDAGYVTDFDQPVQLAESIYVDLRKEDADVYVKLIDRLTLSDLGVCYAMRDRGLTCQVVLNGRTMSKRVLDRNKEDVPIRLFDPVLSVFVHSLGALVEYNGQLYEGTGLGDDFKLRLTPSTSDETGDLRAALEAQQPAEITEE